MKHDYKTNDTSEKDELIEFFSKRFDIIKQQRIKELNEDRIKYKSKTLVKTKKES